MNAQEFQKEKAALIAQYGKPEYDNQAAANESAIQIGRLKARYLKDCRDANKAKKPIQDVAKKVDNYLTSHNPFELSDEDLVGFDSLDRKILRDKFTDLNQTPTELVQKYVVSRSYVLALTQSDAFKALYTKVFEHVLPLETYCALRKAVRMGNDKVVVALAKRYGIIKDDTLTVNVNQPKPIQDPAVMDMLKKLGDQAAKG